MEVHDETPLLLLASRPLKLREITTPPTRTSQNAVDSMEQQFSQGYGNRKTQNKVSGLFLAWTGSCRSWRTSWAPSSTHLREISEIKAPRRFAESVGGRRVRVEEGDEGEPAGWRAARTKMFFNDQFQAVALFMFTSIRRKTDVSPLSVSD